MEETLIAPFSDAPAFAGGDATVALRIAQPFVVEDAFGTIVTMPIETEARALRVHDAAADPIARVEQKLDAAMQQIAMLQQQLASLDATLARVLTR